MANPAPPSALTGFLTPGAEEPGAPRLEGINRILEAVRAHLGMEIAFASRFINGRREFTHIDASIPLPVKPGDSEKLEDTFCHRILAGRLPELIHDASQYPAAMELPLTTALPVGSHLNVPLRFSDGSIYGTFCCVSREPDHSLNERDLSTLRAFADLAAGQIEQQLREDQASDAVKERVERVIAEERLTMVYQPIHSLADGRPVGVESLARFEDRDARPPNEWFADAESVGLGVQLEMVAARQALLGLPYIPEDMYLAVNLSPEAVLSGDILPLLAGIPPERIVVEITEHSRVHDYDALRRALTLLRGHARIAIDDVGAGYSGLRHILDLRPDIIKLDMSLTRDVDRDVARNVLVRALAAFAGGIGSRIVAEGVETEAEAAALRALGIGCAQGYHFSRPMPAVAAQQYLIGSAASADPVPSIASSPRRMQA